MADYYLNHFELSQYDLLRSQVLKLDEDIRDTEAELEDLNKYNVNISPVLTGMPSGNERRDRIAEFIIKLDSDRQTLNSRLAELKAERKALNYRLKRIRAAVNEIPNKPLKDIIIWYYLEGHSVREIADKAHLSENAVYKKIGRFHRCGSKRSG